MNRAKRVLTCCTLLILGIPSLAAPPLHVIARSGQPDPTGKNYWRLGYSPVINDRGTIVFTDSESVYSHSLRGATTSVEIELDVPIPGLGLVGHPIPNYNVADDGSIALDVWIGTDPALVVGSAQRGFSLVMQRKSPLTGSPSYTTSGWEVVTLSPSGKGATLYLSTAGAGTAYWSQGDVAHAVNMQSQPAPFVPGATIATPGYASVSDAGSVFATYYLNSPSTPIGQFLDATYQVHPDGQVEMRLVKGMSVNAQRPGESLWRLLDAVPNGDGDLVFRGEGKVPTADNPEQRLWIDRNEQREEVISQNLLVSSNGNRVLSIRDGVRFNRRDHVMFIAEIRRSGGPSFNNMLGYYDGELHTVAMTGDDVPGFPGVKFLGINSVGALNDADESIFFAQLSGPGVTTANDQTLMTWHPGGTPTVIVREGDTIEVAPGVLKTLTEILVSTVLRIGAGMPRPLNDYGDVTFAAKFSDGSTAVLATTLVAPLVGDFNNDAVVDFADFQILERQFGKAGYRGNGDANADGWVNHADFQLLFSNFGETTAAAMRELATRGESLPEPAAVALVLMTSLVSMRRSPRVGSRR